MRYLSFVAVAVLALGFAAPAHADHAWGNYHWARTANPFTIPVVDSLTPAWDSYLDTTIADWNNSTMLDLAKEEGKTGSTDRKRCVAITGKIRACNQAYGKTGWLGIASIWASGSHITKATTKVNDTYFGTATYNTSAWKNLVMCQEIAHDFGLDHQDENFSNANLGTCMDYTSLPESNQHPNAHDYEMIETIYAHLDTSTTLAVSAASWTAASEEESAVTEDPRTWGRETHRSENGRSSTFEKSLRDGSKVITHVFWEEGAHERMEHREH